MTKMIDADKLVENLRLIATCWSISPFVSKEKHNGAVDMLREVEREVKEAPTLTPPNEALTIEQLREMDGEPVWVQNLEEPEKSQWRLLHWDRGKYLVLQGISVRGYLLEEYGESWLAYRRPPEEET